MKKALSICLALVLVMCMTVTASAAGFVSSPSTRQAPTIVKGELEDNCTGTLVITSYSDRNGLSTAQKTALENAATAIKGATDLSKLNSGLTTVAKNNKISTGNLAVSDLFNVGVEGCTDANHGHYDLILKPETLANFVALMYCENGEWKLVKDAKVTNNGTHLEFTEDFIGPFAIVVSTKAGNAPNTGDNVLLYALAVVMVASAAAMVFFYKKSKQQA